ncbi:MAG TPA: tyrosine--tRNA ligase [Candidatus Kaiserbacteria bacterium]|nr:tyrosine--tRNA ligase [Candidatus Kaiserbacteria bacterium]
MKLTKQNKINTDEKAIDKILNRGTIVETYPTKEDFREKLLSGERLRFYIGFDATGSTLHLSHAKNFILLEDFRKLGHEVIVLFGDFTARIGDPTNKKETRGVLSRDEVLKNIEKWKQQISPLMDFNDKVNPPRILNNHDWLSKLTFEDIISLASNFTVQQMLERNMFDKRIKAGNPIHLHEFLYPLMQGYDSVAMDVDVELCGTDQTFNALVGRTLLRKLKNKNKFVVVATLMENPKTGKMMSKSEGRGIFLDTNSEEMFGEVMAEPDEMIEILFTHVTRISLQEIQTIISGNPKDAKTKLAEEIVKIFFGDTEAKMARVNFDKTFSKNRMSNNALRISVHSGVNILDVPFPKEFIKSKNELRRLIESGAVSSVDSGEKITNTQTKVLNDINLKIGKHRFIKLNVK